VKVFIMKKSGTFKIKGVQLDEAWNFVGKNKN
jgi:hypothetical protein